MIENITKALEDFEPALNNMFIVEFDNESFKNMSKYVESIEIPNGDARVINIELKNGFLEGKKTVFQKIFGNQTRFDMKIHLIDKNGDKYMTFNLHDCMFMLPKFNTNILDYRECKAMDLNAKIIFGYYIIEFGEK